MKKLVIGILAHVDAGKTTLSESLLYLSGRTRKLGRVDRKDAYLDNYELERARGITIFSKQAVFDIGDVQVTLLDTPGHVDFSTEMERTLQVLDYAVLVISGADGVQGHTRTLWHLLDAYRIPVFLFINKMDQDGTDRERLMDGIKKQLSHGCVDFGQVHGRDFMEQVAMCDEELLSAYLETGRIDGAQIREYIRKRRLFPCYFGAALRLEGVDALMQGLVEYSVIPSYPDKFGARVFKISRDEQGNRLSHIKVTGGTLKVRDVVGNGTWEEKVNQIRIYSGSKFEAVNNAEAGTVCAVAGLTQTRPGEGLGADEGIIVPVLEPVLSYRIILPDGCDPGEMLPKLRQLEDEDPALRISWDEQLREIQAKIMGEVQTEVLQSVIKDRFGTDVSFDAGRIIYKETIADTVEGVGHFEPLRHYAEVHLLLEPGERGSGLQFAVDCSDDILAGNWKNLILTHLKEKEHKGVLTGYPITDMKITLVSGRAHISHTSGGDFREATYRAVRQGLMEAGSVLLEPYYSFRLEVPEKLAGHALADIDKMRGTCAISRIENGTAYIEGEAPVATMKNYQKELTAYTRGMGKIFCSLKGYEPCHNAEEVIEMIGYDPERDVENPSGSVFCANGSGFFVSWDRVKDYMHVESYFKKVSPGGEMNEDGAGDGDRASIIQEKWLAADEVDRILTQSSFANQGKRSSWKKRRNIYDRRSADDPRKEAPASGQEEKEEREEYLLVDGYNIIFAWPELKEMAQDNMDSARTRLLDLLGKYRGMRKCRVIAVFDAYRVQRRNEDVFDYDDVHVVFTKEAQTADEYIEKFAHDNRKRYDITVATSDNLQQVIILGAGCSVMSAGDLKKEIESLDESISKALQDRQVRARNYVGDLLSDEVKERMKEGADSGTGSGTIPGRNL
ncbi:MAG: GTP-binding protein [Clostridiaceae bacterium]|nr:GTP-binding protein [Clostridiaceae bacterium]